MLKPINRVFCSSCHRMLHAAQRSVSHSSSRSCKWRVASHALVPFREGGGSPSGGRVEGRGKEITEAERYSTYCCGRF